MVCYFLNAAELVVVLVDVRQNRREFGMCGGLVLQAGRSFAFIQQVQKFRQIYKNPVIGIAHLFLFQPQQQFFDPRKGFPAYRNNILIESS